MVMEWTDESLRTAYRDDRTPVEGIQDLASQLREIAIESEIEFWELITDEKYI